MPHTPRQHSIPGGVAHRLPLDLRQALQASPTALSAWLDITALARNEWICWIESVKKAETRNHHLQRAIQELCDGKRRPCCWMGCTHRTDKQLSATQQWILSK